MFSILKENGELSITTQGSTNNEEITSFMKMNGFSSISVKDGVISGTKPKWQSTGASLKRNVKQA